MNEFDPIVGNWYQNRETQHNFLIVAIDEKTQTLEIQDADGQLEELDLDSWHELLLEVIEPPEDYDGAYEALNPEDLGYNSGETGIRNPDQDPARQIHQALDACYRNLD